ncbi:suppressor of SWI4 1 homolog isoform X1 [Cygnus atratus]|uniref:suppressor of SWI4 1 homolog isoform X1 n=1 Tax=Cygnus atratus TaxID=8868 RepID=UPI0015D5918B|nr:suppressor of SWI4 1 homolog isoform X1 [Cygnus atratus]
MGRPSKTKNQKKERAAALQQAQQDFGTVPHSFVFHRGRVGKNVRQLILDVRRVMEPYTARALKVRKKNSMKDFVAVAGPLGVTHFLVFSKSSSSINFKLFRLPGGPTLTFKVTQYSLIKDVVSSLKRHRMHEQQFTQHPLLVLSNFGLQQIHVKLMASMFQNMFPSINVHKVNLNSIKRCLLVSYDAETQLLDFRHYSVKVVPVGVSKGLKKLLQEKFPNMSRLEDISELLVKCVRGQKGSEAPSSRPQRSFFPPPPGQRHKPVGERGRAGRDPQHPGAAASLRRPGEHEGAAERRAPHRDRAPHDAAAREGGGGLGAGRRALPQLHSQNGGGGAGDPGAEGGEAAAEDGAAAAAGGGRGAQAAAAGGSPGEEPGGDPEEKAAGRRQRRRGPRGAGAAGSGRAVGRERRRVLPAGGGRGARRRSLSQPHQEAARPLGLRRAAETPAAQPAGAARSPETSPGSTGEAAEKGSGADGLEAPGSSRAKSGTRKRAAGPGGTGPRPQEEREAADKGKKRFSGGLGTPRRGSAEAAAVCHAPRLWGEKEVGTGEGGRTPTPAPGQYTLGTTTWRRVGRGGRKNCRVSLI